MSASTNDCVSVVISEDGHNSSDGPDSKVVKSGYRGSTEMTKCRRTNQTAGSTLHSSSYSSSVEGLWVLTYLSRWTLSPTLSPPPPSDLSRDRSTAGSSKRKELQLFSDWDAVCRYDGLGYLPEIHGPHGGKSPQLSELENQFWWFWFYFFTINYTQIVRRLPRSEHQGW